MAVYEQTYKRYVGPLTPDWSRFLIIPRHAFRNVFKSKIFTGLFALSFAPPLAFAVLIYLRHNAEALEDGIAKLARRAVDVVRGEQLVAGREGGE